MDSKHLVPCEYCGHLIQRFDVVRVHHNLETKTNHFFHRSCWYEKQAAERREEEQADIGGMP